MKTNEYYMGLALKEAQKAYMIDEVPIGCVIVKDDKVIARGYNKKETNKSALSHAEMIAIAKASKKLGDYRLNDCTMYVTLEPCAMCAGAIISARISNLVYSAKDPRYGAHESFINLFDYNFNHKVNVISGVLENKSSKLIKDFFKELRNK